MKMDWDIRDQLRLTPSPSSEQLGVQWNREAPNTLAFHQSTLEIQVNSLLGCINLPQRIHQVPKVYKCAMIKILEEEAPTQI